MMPDRLFSTLLLVGRLGLCLMLDVVGPYHRATAGHKTPRPAQSPRQRSQAPQSFAGLRHKPVCAACPQRRAAPQPPSPVPHAPMPVPHRRPRQVETSPPCCPQATWA
jgi:hypothetical protein